MTSLMYRPSVCVSELDLDECTVHRAGNSDGAKWWLLWFRVARETDGVAEDFCVPINPNGAYTPDGPGGKTWGLCRSSGPNEWNECVWQVSPSINVLGTKALHPGETDGPSLWHQTPEIICVPDHEAWIAEAP